MEKYEMKIKFNLQNTYIIKKQGSFVHQRREVSLTLQLS